jgi:hypothetical protein
MTNLVKIGDITVNISNVAANCTGIEQDVRNAINELDLAKTTSDADRALTKIISFHNQGVLFPNRLLFNIAKSPSSRVPSIDTIMLLLPGAGELYQNLSENWTHFDQTSYLKTCARRMLVNLSLCTNCISLVEMSPLVFGSIMSSWKNSTGYWEKEVAPNDNFISVINNIGRVLSRLNQNNSYQQSTRQPRTLTSKKIKRSQYGPDHLLANPNDGNRQWIDFFNDWLHGQALKNTKNQKAAFAVLMNWVMVYPEQLAMNPTIFLSKPRTSPTLIDFLKGQDDQLSKQSQIHCKYINRFSQWIIDSYLRVDDDDGPVSIGISPLSFNDLRMIEGAWDDGTKPCSTTSRPLPTAWRLKAYKILTDNDHFWPKSLHNQHFDWLNPETGEYERIWVPTLSNLFETMLELPLRRIQVCCLDSGEGDEKVHDPATGKFVINHGPAAGYWKTDLNARVKRRGVLKDFSKAGKPLVGFHINTNKTADKNAPDSEKTGYDIPWQNETVIKIFTELREWQQKYNPLLVPTSFSEVSKEVFGYNPTDLALKMTPDRFYLFRTPCGTNNDSRLPVTYSQCFTFWNELIAELERVLRQEGEDVTLVETWNEKSGAPSKVAYNIHGLRVATLTAFAEAGVPIEILSKIVAGHASILMTIYYLKFNEVTISNLLLQKSLEIRGNAAEQLRRELENLSWERAKRLAVYNDEECFKSVMGAGFGPLWSNEGYGVCPHGGTRCEDGGPVARKEGKKAVYGAVPGGKHNCLRCRHFITGTPFLIQLWMKVNKLLVDSQKMSAEYARFVSELKELEDQKYRMVKEGLKNEVSAKMIARIKELEGVCDNKSNRLNETLLDLHVSWRLLEGIKELPSDPDCADKNTMALLCSSNADLSFNHREGTRFEAIFNVIQASRIYPFLEDESIEMEARRYVDIVLIREHLEELIIDPLTPQEMQQSFDAIAHFLLTQVGAVQTQQVYEGKISLRDLGMDKRLKRAVAEAIPRLARPETQNSLEG